jgi:cathepsin C
MIYDEGFEVAVGDLNYFAFSKFSFEPGTSLNISHCGETEVGWYHNTARDQWGCYFGRKVNPAPGDTVHPTPPAPQADADAVEGDSNTPAEALDAFGSALDVATPVDDVPKKTKAALPLALSSTEQTITTAEQAEATTSSDSSLSSSEQEEKAMQDIYTEPPEYQPWIPKSAGYDKPMPGNWQEGVASALNFLQLGWTASAYDQFMGKTPRQLNKLAGTRRARVNAHHKDPLQAGDAATSFLAMSSKHRRAHHRSHASDEAFDWRNKDGQNFLTPVVTQGDCGSCYTISTIHMLTARNRVRANDPKEPSFSVSFPLYCSEYNQGCDGGYGFLMSKWNEDVGLVPGHCAPFSQGGGSCKIAPGCDLGNKRYRAHNHHYVGGYYGASDAEAIRKELVERGPLVLSFEPQEDFMYYKNGVYRSGPNKIHQEWEQVDHAVLLNGYGAEGQQAYWTLQNSWGQDWGEAGYFRMARGSDESGCESIAVAAEVIEESTNPVLDGFIAEL